MTAPETKARFGGPFLCPLAGTHRNDMTEPDDTEEVEFEVSDFELHDGEVFFADGKAAFCEQFGVVALQSYEGGVFAYSVGKGCEPLHDFLYRRKAAVVRPVG